MIDTRKKKLCSPTDNDNEKSASTPNAKAQSRQTNTPAAVLLSLLHCLYPIVISLLSTPSLLALENSHLNKTLKQEPSQTYLIFSCFFASSLKFFHFSPPPSPPVFLKIMPQ